ncbi:hypothetical protein [Paraburkholderia sp.]|uniref:hypothetical protein n=1 Tax=Paraburkholderia sp. TaxID=1926495 RepID=UPI00286FA178|nr:hypothetical protein [Paraburkholderia sp.]
MKGILFAAIGLVMSGIAFADPPSENVLKSCLRGQSVSPAVTMRNLNVSKVAQKDNYVDGLDAIYMFEYRGADAGYAEGKVGQALIYLGRAYRLSKSISVVGNNGIKRSAFDPTLAQWSVVNKAAQKYFCVSFNFDGLGRSGSFQNVRGGYLLDTKSKILYFVVRDISK